MLSAEDVRSQKEKFDPFQLSKREIELLEGIADGLSNRQIGERFFICNKTVTFHLTRIFKKLGVKNRLQLYRRIEGILCQK